MPAPAFAASAFQSLPCGTKVVTMYNFWFKYLVVELDQCDFLPFQTKGKAAVPWPHYAVKLVWWCTSDVPVPWQITQLPRAGLAHRPPRVGLGASSWVGPESALNNPRF